MNLISIIVPVYNVDKYLKQCIESIINQTHKGLEIILVNDGSTDISGEICDEYASKDNRIIVIHKVNEGSTSAIKEGIKIASGEYIGFIDSDDYIELDMYERLLECIINNKADLVQCNMCRDDGVNKYEILDIQSEKVIKEYDIKEYLIPQLLNFWNYKKLAFSPSRCNKLYRKDLVMNSVKDCNSNITYGEDLNLILSILLNANKVSLLNRCLYNYRLNNQSITSTYKKRMDENNEYLTKALIHITRNEIPVVVHSVNIYIDYLLFQEIKNEINSSHNTILKWKSIKLIGSKHHISEEFYSGYWVNSTYTDKITLFSIKSELYFLLFVLKYVKTLKNKLTVRKKNNE